jgi:hypothetical protein
VLQYGRERQAIDDALTGEGDVMNMVSMVGRLRCWFGLCLFLLLVTASQKANAQLAGLFRSAPGTLATYEYQGNGFQSVMLPADITVFFSNDSPTSMLTATIHKPIIGNTQTEFDYPIVNEFPMVVTGTSSDGRRFHGDLLGTQYLFDWEIEPATDGQLLWNGKVYWAGGRYELTTITDARLIAALPGDYNQDDTVGAADYVVWRDMLGQMGPGLAADGNGNNQIDSGDYDIWWSHFGQTAGSGSGAFANAAVPEPMTMVLLMFAAAGWCLRRGRAA